MPRRVQVTGGEKVGAILSCSGGVAQSVERYVRNVEVGGSSPLTCTVVLITTFHLLRGRF